MEEKIKPIIHRLTDFETIADKYLMSFAEAFDEIEAKEQAYEHGEQPSMAIFIESLRRMRRAENREEYINRLPEMTDAWTMALVGLMLWNNRNLIGLLMTLFGREYKLESDDEEL